MIRFVHYSKTSELKKYFMFALGPYSTASEAKECEIINFVHYSNQI